MGFYFQMDIRESWRNPIPVYWLDGKRVSAREAPLAAYLVNLRGWVLDTRHALLERSYEAN
jgi:hypothetical protein